MNNISSYLQAVLLANSVGYPGYALPTVSYLALFINVPTQAAGSGVEVFAGDYERQAITWNPPEPANVQGVTQMGNANAIRFPAVSNAVNDWGTVQGAAVMDAFSGGNYLWVGPLAAATEISVGGFLLLSPQAIAISLD